MAIPKFLLEPRTCCLCWRNKSETGQLISLNCVSFCQEQWLKISPRSSWIDIKRPCLRLKWPRDFSIGVYFWPSRFGGYFQQSLPYIKTIITEPNFPFFDKLMLHIICIIFTSAFWGRICICIPFIDSRMYVLNWKMWSCVHTCIRIVNVCFHIKNLRRHRERGGGGREREGEKLW